jgi:hypothetical protein
MNIRLGRLAIYANKVAKGNNGENPSWHGYCYGYYLPHIKWQKSNPCYCLDLAWLIFFISIYWNRK